VFDHHDLGRALRLALRGRRTLLRATELLERATFGLADRHLDEREHAAVSRRGARALAPDRTTVVRSAPDLSRFVL
jgi:hypothetical protein